MYRFVHFPQWMNVILRVGGHGINGEVVEGMGELIEPLNGIVDEEATDEQRNLAPTQHSKHDEV